MFGASVKGKLIISLVAVFLLITTAQAKPVSSYIDDSFAELSKGYASSFKSVNIKKGIAIIKFKELSKIVKKNSLGSIIADVLSGSIVKSNYFFLIDRENLSLRLKEIELSMSGIVNESAMLKTGQEAGVSFFLTGSISESGKDFLITMKLIDVETGKVVSTVSFNINQNLFLKKRRQIEYGYISKHGIGINLQTSYFIPISDISNYTLISDFYISYRPFLQLTFKIGLTHLYFSTINDYPKKTVVSMFPTVSAAANYVSGNINSEMTTYGGATINEIAPSFGAEYNLMITEKFSIAFGCSVTLFVFKPIVLEQIYSGAVLKIPDTTANNTEMQNTLILKQEFDLTAMIRFEVRPQYFITPRLTVGLYLAAVVTPPLKINKTDFGQGYVLYPNNEEGATDPADKRYGFNPKNYGLTSNVETGLNLSGFSAGLLLSFYF